MTLNSIKHAAVLYDQIAEFTCVVMSCAVSRMSPSVVVVELNLGFVGFAQRRDSFGRLSGPLN